ncbi:MAG: tRNA C32,U32 (ribose-2'-O)-methylase TrmJ [Planctomycetota bacterium]|jgi:tRNA C32,U32 (ribose-2'-O)-methylase TrmJ
MSSPEPAPRRLRRAEAVLLRRTSRVILVLERPWHDENVQAVLRTAESFGVQHVWTIRHPDGRQRGTRSVTRGSDQWLSTRFFEDTAECISALRAEGCQLWATDLDDAATEVTQPADLAPLPSRIALIMGREVGGVSPELLAAADRRLYLPMQGFTESLNLSVAAALMLQRLFDADPSLRGSMQPEERAELRAKWYERLAGHKEYKRAEFAAWLEHPPEPLDDTRTLAEFRQPRMTKKLRRKIEPGAGS